MTKKQCALLIFVSFFLMNCGDKRIECDVCGDFQLLSFSKKEINLTANEVVTIHRNLTMDKDGGEDYYTVLSWDENQPDSSWTENLQKSINLAEGSLTIKEDGTWKWQLKTEEKFVSTLFFGEKNYRIKKSYQESGTWSFFNEKGNVLSFVKEKAVNDNWINILDKNNADKVIEQFPFQQTHYFLENKEERKIQVLIGENKQQHVFTTVQDSRKKQLDRIAETTCSIIDGDILMVVNKANALERLAARSN